VDADELQQSDDEENEIEAFTQESGLREARKPRSHPPVPDTLSNNDPLIPPVADDASLRKTHDVHVLSIGPSTKLETKVRQALSLLKENAPLAHEPGANKDKPAKRELLIALVARSHSANKCVSIVEIVKREFLKENDVRLFQYSAVWSQLEHYEPKKTSNNGVANGQIPADTLENVATEMDSVSDIGRPKVRNVSCLAIYLACQPISKLKEAYRLVQ